MNWPDRIEKLSRAALWVVMASVVVLVPLTFMRHMGGDDALRGELRAKEGQLQAATEKLSQALEPKEPTRLSLRSMGTVMRSLVVARAEGNVYFTNVSPRSGVVCLTGVATNTASSATSESLPSCVAVQPYSSATLQLMFAGGDLQNICGGKEQCEMGLREADASVVDQAT